MVNKKDDRKDGVALIAEERRRQIVEEGWTAEHDDEVNTLGRLAFAAVCYAVNSVAEQIGFPYADVVLKIWPWDEKWWKPKDPIRDLVKAGALIAAEIDRLKRLEG